MHDLAAHIGRVRDAHLTVHDDREVELLVVEEAGHRDVIAAVPQRRLRAGPRHQRPAISVKLTQKVQKNSGTHLVLTTNILDLEEKFSLFSGFGNKG